MRLLRWRDALLALAIIGRAQTSSLSAEDSLFDLRAEARQEVAAAARVEVKTTTTEQGKGEAKDMQVEKKTVALSTGEAVYTLEYVCATDEATGRRLEQGMTLSELGMATPAPANWYQGGFIDVVLDGEGLVHVPAKIDTLQVPEGSAATRFTWSHPRGEVTATFRTLSFDSVLYVTLGLPAAASRRVTLLCYPNSFQLPRNRWITTPNRDVQHRDNLIETLGREERDWVLYSDRSADLVAAPTTGPRALVLLPDQMESVRLAMGRPERPDWPAVQNYGIMTDLTPVPAVTRLSFALIDFLPMTWTQAEARLREETSRVREILTRLRKNEN